MSKVEMSWGGFFGLFWLVLILGVAYFVTAILLISNGLGTKYERGKKNTKRNALIWTGVGMLALPASIALFFGVYSMEFV